MKLRSIIDENFQDFKKPSMNLITCYCDGKCWKEQNLEPCLCHNKHIIEMGINFYPDTEIIKRYLRNPITKALLISGLEPFFQFTEVMNLIKKFRKQCSDTIVIYTGFYEDEVESQLRELKAFNNIIIKFGRYRPSEAKRFDENLGVYLASSNQYSKTIEEITFKEICREQD